MASTKEAIREVIERAWKNGKSKGLSDEEIIQIIEDTLKQKRTERSPRKRGKYTYTPMTDEQIRDAQEKIGIVGTERVETVHIPQVLYGPPPRQEVHTVEVEIPQVLYGPPPRQEVKVVEVEAPQVLYGPPPRQEISEMFVEETPQKSEGSHRRK